MLPSSCQRSQFQRLRRRWECRARFHQEPEVDSVVDSEPEVAEEVASAEAVEHQEVAEDSEVEEVEDSAAAVEHQEVPEDSEVADSEISNQLLLSNPSGYNLLKCIYNLN